MTDINPADLSRQLALALGWKDVYPNSLATEKYWKHDYAMVSEGVAPRGQMMQWRRFNYCDPSVVVPLLKWLSQPYGAVRIWPSEESWNVRYGDRAREVVNADTLELAVARAVIAVGVR